MSHLSASTRTRLAASLLAGVSLCVVWPTEADGQPGPRGVPRMELPQPPERPREQPKPPTFRAEVTRVEVSAVVVDASGQPVLGLRAADFEVREEGVPQKILSFIPFVFDSARLTFPEPVLAPGPAAAAAIGEPTSNYYASVSRVFALVLDDLHIDARRTLKSRAAARRLVERLAPSDLLYVRTTSSSFSTGAFTRDRVKALQIIDELIGAAPAEQDHRRAPIQGPRHGARPARSLRAAVRRDPRCVAGVA